MKATRRVRYHDQKLNCQYSVTQDGRVYDREGWLINLKKGTNTMTTYTADDFKNARFAESIYGATATRNDHKGHWVLSSGFTPVTDEAMATDSAWAPVREAAPLSLDTLREAWENAEVPAKGSPIREGDLVITLNGSGIGGYFVRPSHDTLDFELEAEDRVRILARAPRCEPWADLRDVLKTTGCDVQVIDPETLASVLHERGVRVMGGDDQ